MSSVSKVLQQRNIRHLVHFTTNSGLVGILRAQSVLSRQRLPDDDRLTEVFEPNAVHRRDTEWLDYVNLSVERLNLRFFDNCRQRYRGRDRWWCVLCFRSEIAAHDGVHFSTTNNFYSGVKRLDGAEGLEALYASRVHQYKGNYVERDPLLPANLTTCPQAEVLCPMQVDTRYLEKVYVSDSNHADVVAAQGATLRHPDFDIQVDENFTKLSSRP